MIAALGPVLEPLAGILVLAWVRASQTPWNEIGYVRPKSWVRSTIVGVAFGSALKLFLKAIAMPLLGAPPINSAYHYLVGNTGAFLRMALFILVAAGFSEETVFRGFLFERLGKLFGASVPAKIAIVLLTSAWFSVVHYADQGLAGVEQAAISGLVFGTIFAITGRIWMLMVTHAAFDLAALAIIYWNIESRIAHLVFK